MNIDVIDNTMPRIYDLSSYYPDFVPFTVNSVYPVHRWYRFKEGFSRDLVHLVLGLFGYTPTNCLDPFTGSGTTPLACQEVGVNCHSIEVNPFLHHLTRVKLVSSYSVAGFDRSLNVVSEQLSNLIHREHEVPVMSTITERSDRDKWLFDLPVMQAILAIRHSFENVNPLYADLFLVILASLLTEIGNTKKDGKCVRYKKEWRSLTYSREDVTDLFFDRTDMFRRDVEFIESHGDGQAGNADFCIKGNALEVLEHFSDRSVDAVITSPPYLNSFDYTDVYMPELWALGFVQSYEEVRALRANTLRSHVQVNWAIDQSQVDERINAVINEIVEASESMWNARIPQMIAGYFADMRSLLSQLKRVMKPGSKAAIIVATSSYYKVVIPTDIFIGNLATELGFAFEELRVVRRLKRSSKQASEEGVTLPRLRESIVILRA